MRSLAKASDATTGALLLVSRVSASVGQQAITPVQGWKKEVLRDAVQGHAASDLNGVWVP